DDLVSAAAINSTNYNLARVIGPTIAGIVIAAAGVGAAFALNALSYIAVLVSLSRNTHPHVPGPGAVPPSVFSGVRFIAAREVLRGMTLQMVLLTIFAGAFLPMLPVFAREVLRVGAAGYGSLIAAVGIGAACGAIVMGAMGARYSRGRI